MINASQNEMLVRIQRLTEDRDDLKISLAQETEMRESSNREIEKLKAEIIIIKNNSPEVKKKRRKIRRSEYIHLFSIFLLVLVLYFLLFFLIF
jgi:hypothetical protein